jgi:hypothetical protein
VTISFVMSACLSVHLSTWNLAPTGKAFVKFDIWVFLEYLSKNSSSIKIWQEEWVLYIKAGQLQPTRGPHIS